MASKGDEKWKLEFAEWLRKVWHPWFERFKVAREAASGNGPLLNFPFGADADPGQWIRPLMELRDRLAQIENFGPTSSTERSRLLRAELVKSGFIESRVHNVNSTGSSGWTR